MCWTAKVAERSLLALVALLPFTTQAQRILDRHVRVDAQRIRCSEALALIAREGDFKLSYNAAAVNGDSLLSVAFDGTVEQGLYAIVGRRFELKETGNHIILLDKGGARHRFRIRGAIYDAETKGPVVQASVHEVDGRSITSTDALGTFDLEVSGDRERTAILVSRKEYHDTVVYIPRNGEFGRLALRKRAVHPRMEPLCVYDRCGVEDLGVARLLVPNTMMYQTAGSNLVERSTWQLSLIPNVSTNGAIAGVVVNTFSFNLLVGYARGLEGFEIGTVANIESHDVKGLQIAGLTNLVGRSTNGVQVAGAINHTMRTLVGLQLAGLGNTVWDTLAGVQVAGGANIVKGGLRGTQIAGACNVAVRNVDGIQIAGGVNVTPMDVRRAQVAGAANYARQVSGAQVAAGVNVARDTVGGGQVGLAANYARVVTGGQVSCGLNVALQEVSGGQVGLAMNYAGSITGGQFSFGLNVVGGTAQGGQIGTVNYATRCHGGQLGILNISDTISGTPIGLLSISRRGYHRVDVSTTDVLPLTIALRTGVRGFHNLLFWSPAMGPDSAWGFGYGFGSGPRLTAHSGLQIELSGEQVMERGEWVDAVNIVGRLGVHYTYHIADRFVLYAGPQFNLLTTTWTDTEGNYLTELAPSDTWLDEEHAGTLLQGWLGYRVGLGLLF